MCVFAPSAAAAVLETAAFILCYHGLHPLATCTENITSFVGRKWQRIIIFHHGSSAGVPDSLLQPCRGPVDTEKAPEVRSSLLVFAPSFTHKRRRTHGACKGKTAHLHPFHGSQNARQTVPRLYSGGSGLKGRHLRCKQPAWHAFRDRTRMRRNLAAINGPCFHSLPCQR